MVDIEMITTFFLGCLFTLPFLIPWHPPGATTLLPETLAFGFGILALITVKPKVFADGKIQPIPLFTIGLATLSAIVACQSMLLPIFGLHLEPMKSVIGVLYISFASALIYTGAQLKITQIQWLQNFLIFGACLVAFSGIVQNYHLNTLLGGIGTEAKHYDYGFAGTIAQRNLFADYIALGLAAVVYQLKPWEFGLRFFVVLLLGSVLALGDTRSGLIYVLILTLAAIPTRNWFALYVPIIYTFTTTLAALLSEPTVTGRIINTPITSDPRIGFAIESILEFARSPLIGVGMGNFGALQLYIPFADPNSHNLFTQIAAETGLIGLACILIPTWKLITTHNWAWPTTISSYLIASLAIMLWHSTIEFPFWYAHFLGLGAVLMGSVYSLQAQRHEK